MNTNELTVELIKIFNENLINILIQFIFIGVVLMLIKTIVEAIVGYILFRIDNFISIGSPVEIYNKKGRIQDVNIFTITVETECGFLRIPTKGWRTSKIINLKNHDLLRNRRASDKKEK